MQIYRIYGERLMENLYEYHIINKYTYFYEKNTHEH